jgi:hypothetical protein
MSSLGDSNARLAVDDSSDGVVRLQLDIGPATRLDPDATRDEHEIAGHTRDIAGDAHELAGHARDIGDDCAAYTSGRWSQPRYRARSNRDNIGNSGHGRGNHRHDYGMCDDRKRRRDRYPL